MTEERKDLQKTKVDSFKEKILSMEEENLKAIEKKDKREMVNLIISTYEEDFQNDN